MAASGREFKGEGHSGNSLIKCDIRFTSMLQQHFVHLSKADRELRILASIYCFSLYPSADLLLAWFFNVCFPINI